MTWYFIHFAGAGTSLMEFVMGCSRGSLRRSSHGWQIWRSGRWAVTGTLGNGWKIASGGSMRREFP